MLKFFISLIFIVVTVNPQTKYYIYFKDKGVSKDVVLRKNSAEYLQAISLLSKRAIERREKTLGHKDIIQYEDLPISEHYKSILKDYNVVIQNELKWFNAVTAYLESSQIEKLAKLPFVDRIEKVKTLRYLNSENLQNSSFKKFNSGKTDLDYGSSLKQFELSDIPRVHSAGINGSNVIIGLLDTGFDWKRHESLQNASVLREYDFIFKDSVTANQEGDVSGQHGHGTYVFSIIGGYKPGSIIGAAYGAKYILAKTEDIRSEKHIEEDNYAAALEWMENLGVNITSSSLGYNEFDPGEFSYSYSDMNGSTTIVTKACERAFSLGVVVITSAGNEGNLPWRYITAPADGFNTIAVGAVDEKKLLASFSSRGPTYDGRIKPDVLAMGVSVLGAAASTTSEYSFGGGTSAAAPIASGAAALLMSTYPHLINEQVRKIFLESSDNSRTPNNDRGYGLLSAAKAISYPNLEINGSQVSLNKIFFVDRWVNPQTVKVNYSFDGINFTSSSMTYDNKLKYQFTFPFIDNNQLVYFYFSYSDSSEVIYFEPAVNSLYKFRTYDLDVVLNSDLPPVPVDYVLGQNFPNPFNNSTRIMFYSEGNESAELFIINYLGQRVRTLFNNIASKGANLVDWNGVSDNGVPCASGSYYYVLRLGNKVYSKRMMLLK